VVGVVSIFLASSISSQNKRSQAAALFTLGVMGDSISDEYRADDNRGGAYAATTLNWLELLVKYKNINAGTWQNWGGYRRTGFEYNYSRSGATTASALVGDGHNALSQHVAAGRIQVVYYQAGSNDFAWYNSIFDDIYSGRLSGSALNTYTNQVISNVRTAITKINESGRARVIVSLVPDMSLAPSARRQFPDTTKLKRVSDAIKTVNDALRIEISQRGYAVFDVERIAQQLLSGVDSQGNLIVGGERISLLTSGDEPHHVQLSDNIHAGTVYSAIYANEFMKVVNASFGFTMPLFTEMDMLVASGIRSGTLTPTSTAIATVPPTTRPTATATATSRPSVSPTATATASPIATSTVRPSNTPTTSPTNRPSVSPSVRPSNTPTQTATPRPTATPNPYAQYCGTYRSLRSVLVRFLSADQIRLWDGRCGI